MEIKVTYAGLRDLMIKQGLKWEDLKKDVPMSSTVVSKLNKNMCNINFKLLVDLAIYFGCDVGDLVCLKKEQKNKAQQ